MSKSCKYRLILSKIKNCKKLSDHLVFCRNILTSRQLTISQLSANCLDGFADGRNCRKRIRDAALYTFVYHYTFAAKSKSLII